jgi:hypothetical protein
VIVAIGIVAVAVVAAFAYFAGWYIGAGLDES